jgi:hypothetical protein
VPDSRSGKRWRPDSLESSNPPTLKICPSTHALSSNPPEYEVRCSLLTFCSTIMKFSDWKQLLLRWWQSKRGHKLIGWLDSNTQQKVS